MRIIRFVGIYPRGRGVGLITAAGFIAEAGDISRFEHPRQIQKLAGLNLLENSFGKHKGKRTLLQEAA